MTRNWLFFRLPRPLWMKHGDHTSRALSLVVPDLVGQLRSADEHGRWFFQRLNDRTGPNLGLWFHSTDEVREELQRLLLAESTRHDWPMSVEDYQPPTAKYRTTHTVELAERLSTASSDFAMELLRDGELNPDRYLDVATRHLHQLVELIPNSDRRAFLFHYWQHWTHGMEPSRRIQLSEEADQHAHAVPSSPVHHDATGAWGRYLRATHAITADQHPTESAPTTYLLFDHAHLTHNRVGIPVAVEAVAAMALRTALGDPAQTVPVRTPTLQAV